MFKWTGNPQPLCWSLGKGHENYCVLRFVFKGYFLFSVWSVVVFPIMLLYLLDAIAYVDVSKCWLLVCPWGIVWSYIRYQKNNMLTNWRTIVYKWSPIIGYVCMMFRYTGVLLWIYMWYFISDGYTHCWILNVACGCGPYSLL